MAYTAHQGSLKGLDGPGIDGLVSQYLEGLPLTQSHSQYVCIQTTIYLYLGMKKVDAPAKPKSPTLRSESFSPNLHLQHDKAPPGMFLLYLRRFRWSLGGPVPFEALANREP